MNKLNLFAFCLPIILFLYWSIVGYSALSILRSQRNTLQNIFLAPALGIIFTLLPIFWLSRLGLPVKDFATIHTIFLFILSLGVWWWKKPIFPLKRYLPFFAIALLALLLTGRPLLEFGFNWLSFANDDMANYCLRAVRFSQHGYLEIPNVNEISSGRNYSLIYWFMDVPGMNRAGADLLLAWLSCITGFSPVEIFMPLIITFQLILFSVCAGLVYQSKSWYFEALTSNFLLACSALISLGTFYQLIAQVLGLVFMVVAATLVFHPFTTHTKRYVLQQSILISITFAALFICYPELAPLLLLSIFLYYSISFLTDWKLHKVFLKIVVLSLTFLIFILNNYLINIFVFIKLQISAGLAEAKEALFPFFLLPSGMANLWNLQTMALMPDEPWLSSSIVIGMILSLLIVGFTCIKIKKKWPAAIITLVMSAMAVFLFYKKNGFGLFKLAMYLQPFLIITFTLILFLLIKNKIFRTILISLYAFASLVTQQDYLKYSRGSEIKFSELNKASENHLINEFKQLAWQIPTKSPVAFDTPNIILAKLAALHFINREMKFYSNDFFSYLTHYKNLIPTQSQDNLAEKNFLLALDKKKPAILNFFLYDPNFYYLSTTFPAAYKNISTETNLILSTPIRTIINRSKFPQDITSNFDLKKWENASNYLIFVNAEMGREYYKFDNNPYISLFKLEKDYFYPNKTFVGIGRYLLFLAVNPSSKVRIQLNITESLNSDKKNLLPPIAVVGSNRQLFPITGRGSARIFSPIVNPQIIAGNPYFLIDMGKKPRQYPVKNIGLMKLYGAKITLDSRYLTGYARDISLISDEEYQNMQAPYFLAQFPIDLANTNLEYSGIYEDGWFSEKAFLRLRQPEDQTILTIKGQIPDYLDKLKLNELSIIVDGTVVKKQTLSLGSMNMEVKVPYVKKNRKIELHFAKAQSLPVGDDRPVAAKIDFIGFKKT